MGILRKNKRINTNLILPAIIAIALIFIISGHTSNTTFYPIGKFATTLPMPQVTYNPANPNPPPGLVYSFMGGNTLYFGRGFSPTTQIYQGSDLVNSDIAKDSNNWAHIALTIKKNTSAAVEVYYTAESNNWKHQRIFWAPQPTGKLVALSNPVIRIKNNIPYIFFYYYERDIPGKTQFIKVYACKITGANPSCGSIHHENMQWVTGGTSIAGGFDAEVVPTTDDFHVSFDYVYDTNIQRWYSRIVLLRVKEAPQSQPWTVTPIRISTQDTAAAELTVSNDGSGGCAYYSQTPLGRKNVMWIYGSNSAPLLNGGTSDIFKEFDVNSHLGTPLVTFVKRDWATNTESIYIADPSINIFPAPTSIFDAG